VKECTKHWLTQRLASLPLIPLFFYFFTQLERMTSRNRLEFIDWVRQPVTAAALLIFIACAFYHARLGVDEIVADYLPAPKRKAAALLANKIFFSVLGIACLYAVLAISFGHVVK